MSLEQRIPAELAARLVGNPYRLPNVYLEHAGHRLLQATVCKCCGTKLTDTVPDPRVPARRSDLKDVDKRTVVLETFVSRLRTAAFSTIELEVEEETSPGVVKRGLHRSTICKACKVKFLATAGPANGQMYYDADLERMAVEDDVHGQTVAHTRSVLGMLTRRNVVRIVG